MIDDDDAFKFFLGIHSEEWRDVSVHFAFQFELYCSTFNPEVIKHLIIKTIMLV